MPHFLVARGLASGAGGLLLTRGLGSFTALPADLLAALVTSFDADATLTAAFGQAPGTDKRFLDSAPPGVPAVLYPFLIIEVADLQFSRTARELEYEDFCLTAFSIAGEGEAKALADLVRRHFDRTYPAGPSARERMTWDGGTEKTTQFRRGSTGMRRPVRPGEPARVYMARGDYRIWVDRS